MSKAICNLLFLILFLPLVSAKIYIEEHNWGIGDNKIRITLDFTPEILFFDYSPSVNYKNLSIINTNTYDAIFFLPNSTKFGNYSIKIITNQENHSFDFEYASQFTVINNSKNDRIIKEKTYLFSFDKTEFFMMMAIIVLFLLVMTIWIFMLEENRKNKRKL